MIGDNTTINRYNPVAPVFAGARPPSFLQVICGSGHGIVLGCLYVASHCAQRFVVVSVVWNPSKIMITAPCVVNECRVFGSGQQRVRHRDERGGPDCRRGERCIVICVYADCVERAWRGFQRWYREDIRWRYVPPCAWWYIVAVTPCCCDNGNPDGGVRTVTRDSGTSFTITVLYCMCSGRAAVCVGRQHIRPAWRRDADRTVQPCAGDVADCRAAGHDCSGKERTRSVEQEREVLDRERV